MAPEENYDDIREAVQKLCTHFPDEYWRELDQKGEYPAEFVSALTDAGYLSILIPEEFGGSGLPLSAACAVLEEIQKSGGNGGACHAQIYTMGTLLRHGSDEQKSRYLPDIAAGKLRLQASDLMVMHACQKADRGIMTADDAAMAKLFASEALGRAADNTVQIYGGMGLMEDLPIERLWRDARLERIWDGTSEVQRHIIARSQLRPYEQ